MGLRISPSILSADFGKLTAECERVSAVADWIHVDVMDNHFVPNLTLGLPAVESLLKSVTTPIDCHLMIANPDKWAPEYAAAGAGSVTFHIEAASNPKQLAADIQAQGARVGVALKPGTALADYEDLLPYIDMLLIMTVEPGFGGQSFMADQMSKVRRARELVQAGDLKLWIQVDGGVSAATIQECAEAGADTFVAGSAVYQSSDPASVVSTLRELAEAATNTSWWCTH